MPAQHQLALASKRNNCDPASAAVPAHVVISCGRVCASLAVRSLLTRNLCLCHAGQTAAAAELYGNWTAAWDRFGWLPEQFDMTMSTVHPIEKVLPAAPGLWQSASVVTCRWGSVRFHMAFIISPHAVKVIIPDAPCPVDRGPAQADRAGLSAI